MFRTKTIASTLMFLSIVPALVGQHTLAQMRAQAQTTTVSSAPLSPSFAYTLTSAVLDKNRSRVLGERLSASGTRYFSVQDSDLAGKSPEEVLKRLSPSQLNASDGARKIEVVVDLRHPVTVVSYSRDPVLIGTTVVHSPVQRSIEVHASILTCDIRVIQK